MDHDKEPLYDATKFWADTIKKIEALRPPAQVSEKFEMGFLEARMLALRILKQLD